LLSAAAFLSCPAPCPARNVPLVIDKGHSGGIWNISISPDGKTIASGSHDGVKLWDVNTGLEKQSLAEDLAGITNIAFSRDGKTIAVSGDGGLALYDLQNGKVTKSLPANSFHEIDSLAFLPDGKHIALVSFARIQTIDLNTGAFIERNFAGGSSALSSDGTLIASWALPLIEGRNVAGPLFKNGKLVKESDPPQEPAHPPIPRKGDITVTDFISGKTRLTLSGHKADVAAVAFSRNGKKLASIDRDGVLIIWDASSGQESARQFTPVGDILSHPPLVFSPDDRRVLWGSSGVLKSVDLTSATCSSVGLSGGIGSLAFFPDGKTLVVGSYDGTVQLWDPQKLQLLRTLAAQSLAIESIEFTCNDKALYVLSSGTTHELKTLRKFDFNAAKVNVIATVPAQEQLIANRMVEIAITNQQGNTIQIWDDDGKIYRKISLSDHVQSFRLSSDLHWFVAKLGHIEDKHSFHNFSKVAIWDLSKDSPSETVICQFDDTDTCRIISIAVNPESRTMAISNCHNQTELVTLWDLSAARLVQTLKSGGLIEFSPDGKVLSVDSRETGVQLWDIGSGKLLHSFPMRKTEPVTRSIAFSQDMKNVAVDEDNIISIWQMGSWHKLTSLQGPPRVKGNDLCSIAFQQNGKVIAAANPSGLIKLWRTSDWHPLCTIQLCNQNDWVVMDAEGHFDASPAAMPLIHRNGESKPLDFQSMQQFYVPGLLNSLLNSD
jgi:WD40 repeat protein